MKKAKDIECFVMGLNTICFFIALFTGDVFNRTLFNITGILLGFVLLR